MDVVQEVRRFNRFYTRLIGLLDEHLPETGFTLPEGRVMYELATTGQPTAADLSRSLGIDKAQLSRLLRGLAARGLVTSEADAAHAKKKPLSLTPAGRVAFAALDHGTRQRMAGLLEPLSAARRKTLVSSLQRIQDTFGAAARAPAPVSLRRPVPGDLGWVIHRQAVLYAHEYGWDWTYEALVATILGAFAASFDPAREDAWIAEQSGQIVGSIFLMAGEEPGVARLRLLYVEPGARGHGLGGRLVDNCISRARELGYRRLTLWTNDVLIAARRIYQAAGFELTAQAPHRSFGKSLVGQTWDLVL